MTNFPGPNNEVDPYALIAMTTSFLSSMSSSSTGSGTSSVNPSGAFVFQRSGEDNFKIYNGTSLSKIKKHDEPVMNVIFQGNKVDLYNDEKKCIATARHAEKKKAYYTTLIIKDCPVIIVDRKSSFTLVDGTPCRPVIDNKTITIIDDRSKLALASFELNTRSFTKHGVLRLFAPHLSNESLSFMFISIIVLLKLQRDRESYTNISGII
ncbi:hypothetical protein WALSEDRAFT_63907 [Wallemia mellicola CBS 633.66]|uniref:Uncharacterized protein n=1 Tax=Wallemia mellicola (strain ATCC MYA-4683 / CBS 633.66) TaxID=671144 RepID=I4YDX6_WALMC|nr:hypothetical protein WALSEDRAFT_63907 [Wallemia mellicola CBS 633.66]EIM22168.1 hypothetical protein WALSEDRAFT_63907 [Wallemia mellicola CBS 633.66]|eukprot:XP_006957966.1 hypothetical protein WALSEDRAFT_63907 [Wallemia mellicola CBS 633.66]